MSQGRHTRTRPFSARRRTPFASRSSCTHFTHHPAFSCPGNTASGSRPFTAAMISSGVIPGGPCGTTASTASRIAAYFTASTR